MAVSRHIELCEAVKTAFSASTFLQSAVAGGWVVQKRFWWVNSFKSVVGKGFIAPLRRQNPAFENLKASFELPILIGVVLPGEGAQSLANTDSDILIQIAEYIEDVFAFPGKNRLPPAIKNAGQGRSNPYTVEDFTVRPGDPYIQYALEAGNDAFAVVATAKIQLNKTDFSSLT